MYFFTHLCIANVIYQNISNEIPLDQKAFFYGNIKPDLPSSNRVHHTLESCLYKVCDEANQLMEPDLQTQDLSVRLGEICHYVSDFFCYYHLEENLHNQNIRHFFYEIRLHLYMKWIILRKTSTFTPLKKEPKENIPSMILEMRKQYMAHPRSLKRDIAHAFWTSMWICQSIIYFRKYTWDFFDEVEQALETFFLSEGGKL